MDESKNTTVKLLIRKRKDSTINEKSIGGSNQYRTTGQNAIGKKIFMAPVSTH